ncbi:MULTISPECIES: transcriptional regulator [unclassified Cryobacterium]|uniref:ArsR/SmtB family transcription factor n=1 Tax=unclassified Cryobacterium TaxID=2649013 RepID=UPI001448672F|nr:MULTISPECIES: helix-turn-helix domain-containing protein [unclassified Cryobacterium]
MEETPGPQQQKRILDLESLKALAHPLRVRIFDALSTYGPATASGLAERLGESSGATSYHLRQLEKHAFVRELEGAGTGRERWWERIPGAVDLGPEEFMRTEAGKQASNLVMNEWSKSRERNLADFVNRGMETMPEEWLKASMINVTSVFASAADLTEFNQKVLALLEQFALAHRARNVPGTRPVQIQFNGFPIVDGEEIPSPETGEKP